MPKKDTSLSNFSSLETVPIFFVSKWWQARHAKHYKDSYFHFWADLLLGSILVALVITIIRLVIWQPQPLFSLEISHSSTQFVSGQVSEFTITYQNREEKELLATEIKLDLPKNFKFISATPENIFKPESTTFTLSEIKEGEKGKIKIKGVLLGAIGDRQAIKASVTYRNGSFTKHFLASLPFTLEDSALAVELDMPSTVYGEQDFNGNIRLKNTSTVEIQDIIINFPSSDFKVDIDQEDENGALWLKTLAPGSEQIISYSGRSLGLGELPFLIEAGFKIGDEILLQKRITRNVEVRKSSLLISVSRDSRSLHATKPVANVSLTLTNKERQDINDIQVSVSSDDQNVIVKNITSITDSIRIEANTIKLDSLAAGQSKNLNLIIALERKNIIFEDSVRLIIHNSYTFNNEVFTYDSMVATFQFNSNVHFKSAGYYYGSQGDQLGIGPIPPQVDIPTTYWITWEVNNIGNNLENMEVIADLPSNVAWSERQSITSGELSYSPVTRRILWQTGFIPRGGDNIRANFAVTLIPQSSDIGTIPILADDISFSAKDQFSGGLIQGNVDKITTNLESDPLSAGKGEVIPTE